VINDQLKKNEFFFAFLIYFVSLLNPMIAYEYKDYLVINMLLKGCYRDTKYCDSALSKLHNYQKNAAKDKKLSCQTRLLGLEANIIMAKNSNVKRKDFKSMIKAVKKYC